MQGLCRTLFAVRSDLRGGVHRPGDPLGDLIQRPLQITADLAAFWAGSYEQVKKEMKGRYPRHYWPDNPLEAMPTRVTKKKMGLQE